MKLIVLQNNEQYGPFDLNELYDIVNIGHFHLTDFCWSEGWSDWKLISSIVKRVPPALQYTAPELLVVESQETLSVFPTQKDEPEHIAQEPNVEPALYSPIKLEENNLKAGMVVKNESQGVSCDFITSLAVRGVFVKHSAKSESLLTDSNSSFGAAFHVARGEEIIAYCTLPEISSHLDSGILLPTDFLWNESTESWMQLSQI
jgi:hypothetical protein